MLVIKLGALGDFVLAFGPFAALRAQHPDAQITLLTTSIFEDLARKSPWFDSVTIDARPAWWNLPSLLRLRQSLLGFDMVYDLQTSGRSGWYHALAGRPNWSGIVAGCSHPHANPGRDAMHTVERQREQLTMAGVTSFPKPDLTWAAGSAPQSLPTRYSMLAPGAAAHRPGKRWPIEHFAALAGLLKARGETPVIVGTGQDGPLAAVIQAHVEGAIDLTGRTNLPQLAAVAAHASIAVGNDTGPIHFAAAMGTRCIALFSAESDPRLTEPRGRVTIISAPDLADLPVHRVAEALPPAQ